MTKKKPQKSFNYAIGHYWNGETGSVGVYNYFGEVHYGTMDDARHTLEYVKGVDANEKKKEDRRDWRIFQLVEVPV